MLALEFDEIWFIKFIWEYLLNMIDKLTTDKKTDDFYFSIKKFKRLPAKHENLSETA